MEETKLTSAETVVMTLLAIMFACLFSWAAESMNDTKPGVKQSFEKVYQGPPEE